MVYITLKSGTKDKYAIGDQIKVSMFNWPLIFDWDNILLWKMFRVKANNNKRL
jgi:hypothetical protein